MINWKGFRETECGIFEVLFRHFLRVTEGNHENFHLHRRRMKQAPPEHCYTILHVNYRKRKTVPVGRKPSIPSTGTLGHSPVCRKP